MAKSNVTEQTENAESNKTVTVDAGTVSDSEPASVESDRDTDANDDVESGGETESDGDAESNGGETDTEADADAEQNTDDNSEELVVKNLIAVLPILFESHLYNPGDKLPCHNIDMVDAWIVCGSAEWKAPDADKKVKVKSASATPGMTGMAVPSGEEDLAGKLPASPRRGRGRK